MSYNPVDHPKIKTMFTDVRPLTDGECKVLLLRLRDGDLGVTLDDLVELTGVSAIELGRRLSRARVSPQLIYDYDDVAPYITLKKGLVFGDDYDLYTPTKEKPEV